MTDCIFCKIINKEIPSYKIYEDSDVFAFLDINPVNFGHTLVIPKKHFENISTTPDEITLKMFIVVKKLMQAIKDSTEADFVEISIVGIDVPHFHIHLIPRHKNDGVPHRPTKKYNNPDQATKLIEKINNFLSL